METINFGQKENNSAPPAPNNRNKKLIWAGVVLAVLILAVIGWQYWQYIHSPYYQQMKAVKMIEAQQKESDKWGGKTPEETVRLFTEAVKKGDFELASKYGKPEIKPDLEKIKSDGNIDLLIKDLEVGEIVNTPGFGPDSMDLVIKENDKVKYVVLSMGKSEGGTWKIDEF
jgi:hypothetical protein